MAATQSTIAIRSYRLYLRDASNKLAQPHDVDLASDEEARELAELMLAEQTAHPCVEVWDRARLVCTVRKDERPEVPPGDPHQLSQPSSS